MKGGWDRTSDVPFSVFPAQGTLTTAIANQNKAIPLILALSQKEATAIQTLLGLGKPAREAAWQANFDSTNRGLAANHDRLQQPSFMGYSVSELLSIIANFHPDSVQQVGLQFLQLGADAVEGVAQSAAALINSGIWVSNAAFGTTVQSLVVPSTNGLFASEPEWFHQVSVFVGGQALTTIATAGLSESGLLCKLLGTGCFVAGTEVITGENADGTFTETPIQDVYVGEMVLSRDQNDPNAPAEEEVVTAIEQHTVYALQDVTIRGTDGTIETIQATPNHPFYVEGQGFTDAGDLTAGEELEQPDGSVAWVVSSVYQPDPQGVTVYNFTVANDHTYFVSTGGQTDAAVWVHNTCPRLFTVANDVIQKAAHIHVGEVELRILAQDGELVFQNLTTGASAKTISKAIQAAEDFLSNENNLTKLTQLTQQGITHLQGLGGRNIQQSLNQMQTLLQFLLNR